MLRLLLISSVFACPAGALAQLQDDFEDRDLTRNPTWVGTNTHWISEEYSEGVRLRSSGPAASDTLRLFAGTVIPYGSWSFAYGYEGGPLSNFNQARIHLWSDGTVGDAGNGVFLAVGTNDRTLKLYSYANDVDNRDLMGSAVDDLLTEESAVLSLDIEHAYDGSWRVWMNRMEVISGIAEDPRRTESGYFGIWIKHSSARGGDHWLDDIRHTPVVRSDSVAPALISVQALGAESIEVHFTEPVSSVESCRPDRFVLLPIDENPVDVRCPPDFTDRAELTFATALPSTPLELLAIGIADPSGNVRPLDSLRFSIPAGLARPEQRDIVINEIDFSPQPAEAEFVELYNRSSMIFDLSRIEISDNRTRTSIMEASRLLAPAQYAVVCRDSLAFSDRFTSTGCVQPPSWPSINNSGDRVAILADRDTIDVVTFESDWGAVGVSLERRDPDGPSDFNGNWGASTDPGLATPGIQNSIFAVDRTPPALVFAEQDAFWPRIVNAFFDEPLSTATITDESFTLAGAPARSVSAKGSDYASTISIEFDSVGPGDLLARDLSDAWGNRSAVSSTRLHVHPQPGSLVVNEILFEPLQDEFDGLPDQPEYIELRSLSPEPLTFSSCVLAGSIREDGTADLFPPNIVRAGVPPNGVAVLVAQGESDLLPVAFPAIPSDSPVIPLKATRLRLRNDGGRVAIGCADGFIDAVNYTPAWHNSAFVTVRGRSLERIDTRGLPDDPSNWTTSLDDGGGTPGRPNSVTASEQAPRPQPGDVVVTEVMFEPRSDNTLLSQPEYLELFNASDRILDLNGIYLRETDDNLDSVRLAYAPTFLNPGSYAVVLSLSNHEATITPRELLNTVFPSSASDRGVVVGLRRNGFRLPNSRSSLTVFAPDAVVLESFRYASDWHHPHLADTRGVSLERISLSSRADDPRSWSSSIDPDGGTPGRVNSVASSSTSAPTGLEVTPSPFSPDHDGDRDHTVISYRLSSDRPSVRITIYDSRGWIVRKLSHSELSARTGSVVWDGRDDTGRTVLTGPYIVYLSAVDASAGIIESHKKVVVVFSALN